MDDTRITPYQLPRLSPGFSRSVAPAREVPSNAVHIPRTAESAITQETDIAQLNPLAALFNQGVKPSALSRKINQSAEELPVRGRFVDLLA